MVLTRARFGYLLLTMAAALCACSSSSDATEGDPGDTSGGPPSGDTTSPSPAPSSNGSSPTAPTPSKPALPSGTLDPAFGKAGVVETVVGTGSHVVAVAVRPDGKIVALGSAFVQGQSGVTNETVLARYMPDGSPDATFGTGGVVTYGKIPYPSCVALQSDGKILVGGQFPFLVARFDADGAVDTTFAGAGLVSLKIASGSDEAMSLVQQPDGRILVAGMAQPAGSEGVLVRLNPDGTKDSTFGNGGVVGPDKKSPKYHQVRLLGDGRIVVVAEGYAPYRGLLLRYSANGALDSSFAAGGVANMPATGEWLFLEPNDDGSYVAGGDDFQFEDTALQLTHFSTSGALDATYGTNGLVSAHVDHDSDKATASARQADGKLLLAANIGLTTAAPDAMWIGRYTANGALDATFASQGAIQLAGAAQVDALALQSDGMILVGGRSAAKAMTVMRFAP